MDDSNDAALKQSIRQSMQEKETEELLEIWRKQDRAEWTGQAFEVIAEILRERLGSLPEPSVPPGQPARNPVQTRSDINQAVKIAAWSHNASWLFLIAGVLLLVFTLLTLCSSLWAVWQPNRLPFTWAAVSVSLAFPLCLTATFIFLQALSQIIYLLIDIENNTRKTAATHYN